MPSTKDKQRAIAVLLDKYDRKHLNRLLRRKKVVDSIYNEIAAEAARIGVACPFDDPDKPFYLKDYPAIEKRIDEMMAEFAQKIETSVIEGNRSEWFLSAEKNAAMIDLLAKGTNIPTDTLKAWKQPNLDALQAFQERKTNGMGLSERVWNLSEQTKSQLELALDVGLGQGKSAAELSRDVRKYLKEPNKLFRRVRDKEGNLRLSKNAQAYHPGQGVYRSSYKNALRMTATENNMAYRTADHDKWNQLDFVIGIEVELSNNHTLNGVPFSDICDMLQGKYPKDFKFTGWHPFCRCIATPILADFDEVLDQMDSDNPHFSGEITDVPEGYNKWIEDNKERIASAKSMPYFIKDNYVGGMVGGGFKWEEKKKRATIMERAAMRHAARTPQQIQDIQDRWALREDEMQYPPEMRAMFREIEKALGIKRGFSMPTLRADRQNANPNYGKGKEFGINCQTCAPAYKLREWGFDVYALGNVKGNMSNYLSLGNNWRKIWEKADHRMTFMEYMKSKGWKSMTEKRYAQYFDEICKEDGTYQIACNWKGGGGHTTIIKRINGKLTYIEPQHDNNPQGARYWDNYEELCKSMSPNPWGMITGAAKIDNAILDKQYIAIFGTNKAIPLHTQRVLNAAAERQAMRTKEEVKAIKKAWAERKERNKSLVYLQQIAKIDDATLLRNFRKTYLKMVKNPDDAVRKAFIDRAAEIRHANRNDAQTQQTWNDWRKQRDLMRKTAENIINVAKDYPWVDSSKLQQLYNKNRSTELVAETKRIAKEMVEIKKFETKASSVIPDVKKWESQFSKSEMETALSAIEKTFARWTWDITTDTSLSFLKGRLEREITVVNSVGRKYSTYPVVKAAYEKRLAFINKRIDMKTIRDNISVDISTALASKNKVALRLVNEFESLFNDDSVDTKELQKAANKITAKIAQLNAKASKNATPLNGAMSDADIKSAVDTFFNKLGVSFDSSDYKIVNGCIELDEYSHSKLAKGCNITSAERTQTWSHIKGGYIRTGNSFTINGAIRDVHGGGANAIHGDITKADTSKSADMYGDKLSADDIKTIMAMDKVIGKNTLPFPIRLNRFVGTEAINSMFGIRHNSSSDAFNAISSNANVQMIPDPAYMSASTNVSMNVFTGRDFLLEIEVPQGTPIYVTDNNRESECVLGRDTKLAFRKIYKNSQGTYVIQCTVIP